MKYICGHCGFKGHCYGAATSEGVSAPWCSRCGRNDELVPLHIWVWEKENELAVQQKRRSRQLLKTSVIIAAICAALLCLGLIAAVYEKSVTYTPAPLPVEKVARFMGMPPAPICENTKSHRVWAACMGVGYDDSPMDKYLYLHREDD